MQEELDESFEERVMEMEQAIEHLKNELVKIRAGKVAPNLVSGILVDYYGSPTPIGQVANVSAKDSKTLEIQPWEKSMISVIERGIFEANLGITPMNNGESVMITLPPVTEERRKDLVKRAKSLGEDAKVSLRSIRHKALDAVKKAVKDGYPEDAGKRFDDKIEKTIKDYGEKVDALYALKEKDIMTI
ncbi:MAG: ribosome recycling factor [Saprospiraceae bacterium]|nr:ribosome recycling factor [Saprospiraceae bacterium]